MDHLQEDLYLILLTPLLAAPLQAPALTGIIILFLLVISFFVSGAEVAFFSLTYKDINNLKTKQDTSWKRIVNLLEEPKALLASLLITNTLVNIAIIILSNFLIEQLLPPDPGWWWFLYYLLKIIAIAFLLLLFGEVLPKIWATQNNFRFAYNASFIVEIIHYLFRRVSVWAVKISDQVELFLGKKTASYSYEELDQAIDLSTNNDASIEEKNILKGIVNFGSITVKQVMRTRLDVSGIDYNMSFHKVLAQIEELHYSRLPVYKSSLDEVVGTIQTKDIIPHLNEPDDFVWHDLLRAPYFVHEQKLAEDLLREFQGKRIHFAVVVDEFGGTSGIVTMEDILEEIIGEIRDEFDVEESVNKKLGETSYIFEGRTMINDLCKLLNISVDTFDKMRGDSDSLGGMILEMAGDFPKPNEVIPCGDFEFTVLEVDRNRVQKVKVDITPHVNANGK